jgi:hypothetical protein
MRFLAAVVVENEAFFLKKRLIWFQISRFFIQIFNARGGRFCKNIGAFLFCSFFVGV